LLKLPAQKPDTKHVYHQYVVRSARRDALSAFLKEHAIGSAILYPLPVHLQPAYSGRIPLGPGGLQETEQICPEILSLPLHPYLTDDQICHISELILHWQQYHNED
jgi:dTDP-4-amino-4,6-dideoxygalactose transaminase